MDGVEDAAEALPGLGVHLVQQVHQGRALPLIEILHLPAIGAVNVGPMLFVFAAVPVGEFLILPDLPFPGGLPEVVYFAVFPLALGLRRRLRCSARRGARPW